MANRAFIWVSIICLAFGVGAGLLEYNKTTTSLVQIKNELVITKSDLNTSQALNQDKDEAAAELLAQFNAVQAAFDAYRTESEAAIAALTIEKITLQNTVATLTTQLQDETALKNALQAQYDFVVSQYEQDLINISIQAQMIAALEADLATKQAELQTVQNALNAANLSITSKNAQLAALQAAAELHADEIAALEFEVSELQEYINDLFITLADKTATITALQADLATAQANMFMAQGLLADKQIELDAAQYALEAANANILTLNAVVLELQDDIAWLNDIVNYYTSLPAAISQLFFDQVWDGYTENFDYEGLVPEIWKLNQIESTIINLKENLLLRDTTISELQAQLNALEDQSALISTQQDFISELQDDLATANAALATAQAEFAAAEGVINDLQADLAAANANAEVNASEIAALEAALEQANQMRDATFADLTAAEEALATAQADLAAALAALAQLQEAYDLLQIQYNDAVSTGLYWQNTAGEHFADLQNALADLATVTANFHAALNDFAAMQQQLTVALQHLQTANERIEELEAPLPILHNANEIDRYFIIPVDFKTSQGILTFTLSELVGNANFKQPLSLTFSCILADYGNNLYRVKTNLNYSFQYSSSGLAPGQYSNSGNVVSVNFPNGLSFVKKDFIFSEKSQTTHTQSMILNYSNYNYTWEFYFGSERVAAPNYMGGNAVIGYYNYSANISTTENLKNKIQIHNGYKDAIQTDYITYNTVFTFPPVDSTEELEFATYGLEFVGWQDRINNLYLPGQTITVTQSENYYAAYRRA